MATKQKTYYEMLGVERNASVDEIRAAYKEIARVYHPDSNFFGEIVDEPLSGESLEKFQRITEAYNTLNDPAKRKAYDQTILPEFRDWEGEVVDESEQQFAEEFLGVTPQKKSVEKRVPPRGKRFGEDVRAQKHAEDEDIQIYSVAETVFQRPQGILGRLRSWFGRK